MRVVLNMAKKQTPEGKVMKDICRHLACKGIFFWRNNNIGVFDPTTKRFRSMPKYAIKGVSDIIAVIDGQAVFIEAKSEKGIQSDYQKKFQRKVEKNGGTYILCRSVDDLIDHI